MDTDTLTIVRSSDGIRRCKSGSILAPVMAGFLTARSHYVNQYCLSISEVLLHSSESNFNVIVQAAFLYGGFEKYTYLNNLTHQCQWMMKNANKYMYLCS